MIWARNGLDSLGLIAVARRGRTLGHVKSCGHKTKNDDNVIHFDFTLSGVSLKAAA